MVVLKNQIVVDGEAVCPTDEVTQSTELKVTALEQALAGVRQKTETLAERAGSSRKFEGKLILQADETIPFHVLQKVMYTSQTVGFYDITLAVIQK